MNNKKKIDILKDKVSLTFDRKPILWLLPPVILLIIFNIYPLIYSIFMSFAKWNMIGVNKPAVIGFANYKEIFLNDPRFLTALRNTVMIIVIALVIEMVLGFLIGILLSINVKGKGVFRTIVMIPIFMMPVVAASVWRNFFSYDDGIINYFLNMIGVPSIGWMMGFPEGIYSAIIVDVWQWTSFVALIIVAGIESLPRDPYEAAIIDGASTTQVIKYITIPLLRYVILVIMFLRVIDLTKFFEVIFVLTGGGPGYSTETMSAYIFYKGLREFDVGYTAALSWVLVMIVIAMMIFFTKFLQKKNV